MVSLLSNRTVTKAGTIMEEGQKGCKNQRLEGTKAKGSFRKDRTTAPINIAVVVPCLSQLTFQHGVGRGS